MDYLLTRYRAWRNWLPVLLLAGLLGLGLAVVGDFGNSYDAGQSRLIGLTNLRYVAGQVNPTWVRQPAQWPHFALATVPLPEFTDRDYGVAFELPVTLAERLLGLTDTRSIYLFRHSCVWVVSWLGLLALYALGRGRYGDDGRLGLAAVAGLVLSPRLFGDMFYNDKDAVFVAFSLGATLTAVRWLAQPTYGRAALHALACALALDVRLMAVGWPLATLGLLGWRAAWGDYGPAPARRLAGPLLLYLALLPALTVALWPNLWSNPAGHFVEALGHMARFRWNGLLLYRGQQVLSTALPWHYAPTWLVITTPLPLLALIGLGLGLLGRQVLRHGGRLYARGSRQWQDLLFAGLGLGPLLAVVGLRSVLYDGWRQLYFVYPPLLLLGLRGLVGLLRWLRPHPRARRLAGAAGVLTALGLAAQLVWLHPFQSLYFNALAGPDVRRRYEQDYWGIGYAAGLRWVLAHDPRPHLRVATEPMMRTPLDLNLQLLRPAERARLELAPPAEADYFLANHRTHPGDYDLPPPVGYVRAGTRPILTIFRVRW